MWFTYGPPTENPFDRDEEISTLIKLMRGGQPVSLVGPRRIGKTSILLASLKKSNLPYVLISAEDFLKGEKGFNFTEFLSAYVSKVILSLHPFSGYAFKLEEKVKSYLKVLRDLLGAVKISLNIPEVSGLIEVVLDKGEKGKDLSEEFSRALELPELLAEKFNIRIVIAIDEFQYLNFAKQAVPEIFHVMRSKWQFQKRVSYVISGSAVGMLKEIMSSKNQPFYQYFYSIRVNPFNRETSKEFLRKGFETDGVKVSEEDIEKIAEYVDGFPAWLNLVGIKVELEGEVEKALSSLPFDDNVISAIEGDLNKLSPTARSVLRKLAKLGGTGSPKDLGENEWSVQRGLKQLIRYGYVEREERGIYKIIDPMVTHYLSVR
ncbi:ATPase [Acidianus hospitalis W1]|uniref:ATPase n=1 Tax=Acidianus hospitalis (strain W1) TaxID=933801 RepID=F4B6C0_ACIHW|nr:ATP-binding protein [Acidianus hospitalis]AEE94540.1 ATPase [Acidianus hospitalis W1]